VHFSEQISIHFQNHIITGICGRCQRFRLPPNTFYKRGVARVFARLGAQ